MYSAFIPNRSNTPFCGSSNELRYCMLFYAIHSTTGIRTCHTLPASFLNCAPVSSSLPSPLPSFHLITPPLPSPLPFSKSPLERKIPPDQPARSPESEGFYVPPRPRMNWKNYSVLENRLVRRGEGVRVEHATSKVCAWVLSIPVCTSLFVFVCTC